MSIAIAASLAIISGCSTTLAAVVISYRAHLVAIPHEETESSQAVNPEARIPSQLLIYICSLSMTALATTLGILACGQGPVAVVFPLSVASSLTSNMVLQQYLGLTQFNKNNRVGTYVLVSAVILISQLGPSEVSPDTNALTLLLAFPAVAFTISSLATMAGSMWLLSAKTQHNNGTLLLLYSLVGGTGTVLNTSISKVVQMDLGATTRVVLILLYVLLSVICLGAGMKANSSLKDPSLFVPMSNGVNLVLNCFAGLCIWRDGQRLHTSALNYTVMYVLVVLGTYLVSSFDLFHRHAASEHVQMVRTHAGKYADGLITPKTTLTRTESDLLKLCTMSDHETEKLEQNLKMCLDKALLSHTEVAKLLAMEQVRPVVVAELTTIHRERPRGWRAAVRSFTALSNSARSSTQSFEAELTSTSPGVSALGNMA